ncbi:MAG: protein O-mannosyl-transferase family, partial [Kiritimatiellia bacterium]
MSFWSRRDGICFLLCFVISLAVYLYSLPPSITLEDAGELVVAADYLGVPHPPGYPIWTFLAWLFQWIFFSAEFRGYPNPAWSVALMSAFFGSLACAGVAVCIRKLIDRPPSLP